MRYKVFKKLNNTKLKRKIGWFNRGYTTQPDASNPHHHVYVY